MGILTECLMLLLLCQALSVLSFESKGDPKQAEVAELQEDAQENMVNKRNFLTCYDSNGKIVKEGKRGTITNVLGSWECTCTDGQWDVAECTKLSKRSSRDTEFLPGEELRANIAKRGKSRQRRSGCVQPEAEAYKSQKLFNDNILAWHNYYRCLHGTGELKYSTKLENVAKANVKMNVRSDSMKHSKNTGYGENLWGKMGWGGGFGIKKITGKDPVFAWYNEMNDPGYTWEPEPTMFSYGTGHFTQVVWKNTKRVGCWTEEHPYQDQGWIRVFTACVYDPAGNMNVGRKAKNIPNWNKNVPPLQ